jgi:hypothetical protein
MSRCSWPWIVQVLNASVSFEDIGRLHPFRVDGWVAAFTIALTAVVTLAFTLLTAHATRGVDVVSALKDESHGTTVSRIAACGTPSSSAKSLCPWCSPRQPWLSHGALQLATTARLRSRRCDDWRNQLNDPKYEDASACCDRIRRANRLSTSPGERRGVVNYPPLSPIRVGVPLSIEGPMDGSGAVREVLVVSPLLPGFESRCCSAGTSRRATRRTGRASRRQRIVRAEILAPLRCGRR